jgi:limonene-1,2-epoxide hydrolase
MSLANTVERLIDFYKHLDAARLDSLGEIYSHDVDFQDPAQHIKGLPALKAYFSSLMQEVRDCRFIIQRTEVSSAQAVIEWQMRFSHPRLNGGKVIAVDGVSLLSGDDKISRHRDYFDLGALLYEHIPLLGGAVRQLKRRLRA